LRYEEERVGSRILTVFLILSTSLPHSTLAVYLRPPRHLAETLGMYSTASSSLSTPTDRERDLLLANAALLSLYEVFAAIPDPRSRHGLRYDLPFLLTCLMATLLCNGNHSEAVAEWCRDHQPLLHVLFPDRQFLCPTGALYRWLLPQLNIKAVEAVLSCWVRSTLVAVPDEPIALDGKVVRGAKTQDHSAPHLLSFRTHQSQETLLQIRVDDKTNEIPVAQALLPTIVQSGRIYTADALHTQVNWMQVVHDNNAFTVLTVKGNQPTLLQDLQTYFADPQAHCVVAETWDRRRGRVEQRCIRVSSEMNAYLNPSWPHIRQVAELTRVVTSKTGTTIEIVYLITDLSAASASPIRLLEVVRGHWSIENGSHYVRDVTFSEDRSQVRTGTAPQIWATFRNLTITLLHRTGTSQIAATRRFFSHHPALAFRFFFQRRFPQQ
jgi:predicted transposase YbfD/YdcC